MSSPQEDMEAIRRLEESWRAGWRAGDTEALLALYADDPVLMAWGQPAVFGKEAIRPLYQTVFDVYHVDSRSTLIEVEVSGDLGYFWCTYRLTATPKDSGEPFEEDGKSLFVVRREHGVWKIARLMDNSDRPPEGK